MRLVIKRAIRYFYVVDWCEAWVAGPDRCRPAARANDRNCHVNLNLLRRHGAERTLRREWRKGRSSMTMQDHQSTGYFQSVTGQLLAFGVGIVVLIVLAAVFVFWAAQQRSTDLETGAA